MALIMKNAHGTIFYDCKFNGKDIGFDAADSSNTQIINCEFSGEELGAQFTNDKGTMIKGSKFYKIKRYPFYIGDYGCRKKTISAVVELNLNLAHIIDRQ